MELSRIENRYNNPVTDQHVKQGATTGKFISAKKGKYKRIEEEK